MPLVCSVCSRPPWLAPRLSKTPRSALSISMKFSIMRRSWPPIIGRARKPRATAHQPNTLSLSGTGQLWPAKPLLWLPAGRIRCPRWSSSFYTTCHLRDVKALLTISAAPGCRPYVGELPRFRPWHRVNLNYGLLTIVAPQRKMLQCGDLLHLHSIYDLTNW